MLVPICLGLLVFGMNRKTSRINIIHGFVSQSVRIQLTKCLVEDLQYNQGLNPALSSSFQVYDWNDDDGYENFDTWVQMAALQAGR